MNVRTTYARGLLPLLVIAASLIASTSQAQPVSPPIAKDIVDATTGEKLGSIIFPNASGSSQDGDTIGDLALAGFSEEDIFVAEWNIDEATGEVSSLTIVAAQSDATVVLNPGGGLPFCRPAVGESCELSLLVLLREELQTATVNCHQEEPQEEPIPVLCGLPVVTSSVAIALVDPDRDGDGIDDDADNCPDDANADQLDTDGDAAGDVCDANDDDDAFDDVADNCPLIVNDDQADLDGDGAGDACDADADGDGVADAGDRCLGTVSGEVADAEGCAIAQLCPCDGPWRHHLAYVACVTKEANHFRKAGLINVREMLRIVLAAAKSQCGKK